MRLYARWAQGALERSSVSESRGGILEIRQGRAVMRCRAVLRAKRRASLRCSVNYYGPLMARPGHQVGSKGGRSRGQASGSHHATDNMAYSIASLLSAASEIHSHTIQPDRVLTYLPTPPSYIAINNDQLQLRQSQNTGLQGTM